MRERKLRLFESNPHCYYCGKLTTIDIPKDGEKNPDNMATIDHIYSKFDVRRYEPSYKDCSVKTVLSCRKCNDSRAHLEEQQIPLQERQLRGFGLFNTRWINGFKSLDYKKVLETGSIVFV